MLKEEENERVREGNSDTAGDVGGVNMNEVSTAARLWFELRLRWLLVWWAGWSGWVLLLLSVLSGYS